MGSPSTLVQDTRELIWLEFDKFAPENHKVSAFITSKFNIQTCVEGVCWKTVTSGQRQWYWDEFVKKYKWDAKDESDIRRVWYKNTADLYRQAIHRWRWKRKHPESVTEAQWVTWTALWDSETWKATASKYKENKNAEPAGPGTGTTKHIAGLKCYAMHVHTLKPKEILQSHVSRLETSSTTLRKQLKREPTSWEIFVHTHQRADGTFVDERSRLLHEQMEAYLEEALTPLDDGGMPDPPLPQEIDRQFLLLTGGPRKGKLYGLSTIASTIYPEAMTPRPRGSASLSQCMVASREEAREAAQRAKDAEERAKVAEEGAVEARRECEELRLRVSSLEESVRLIIGGMPRGSHSGHSLHGRGSSQVGRGSPYTSRSSQGSREGSRASPVGRVHIWRGDLHTSSDLLKVVHYQMTLTHTWPEVMEMSTTMTRRSHDLHILFYTFVVFIYVVLDKQYINDV